MFIPEWIVGAFGGIVSTVGVLVVLAALKSGKKVK